MSSSSDSASERVVDDPADGDPHRTAMKPASTLWSRIAVGAVAVVAGGMLVAVWPSHADPATGSTSALGTPISVATPQPAPPTASVSPTASASASPSASGSASASASATPTTAPVAEGAVVTGLVENVDGLPDTVVAMGDGPTYGDPSAGVITYTVETDQSLAAELPTLLATVEAAFGNTERGWTAYAPRALQRVGSPDAAAIRIVLAPPALVDEACARSGLDTASLYSCFDGAHTMLNSDRWFHATPEFTDLNVYRTYLVNHEFGHGLGYDHEYCPGPGMPAPVMQQQSISLQGCQPNGWPVL